MKIKVYQSKIFLNKHTSVTHKIVFVTSKSKFYFLLSCLDKYTMHFRAPGPVVIQDLNVLIYLWIMRLTWYLRHLKCYSSFMFIQSFIGVQEVSRQPCVSKSSTSLIYKFLKEHPNAMNFEYTPRLSNLNRHYDVCSSFSVA